MMHCSPDSNRLRKIDAAQAILADHVRPDGLSAEEALFQLLELLDNAIVVERQMQWRTATSQAEG